MDLLGLCFFGLAMALLLCGSLSLRSLVLSVGLCCVWSLDVFLPWVFGCLPTFFCVWVWCFFGCFLLCSLARSWMHLLSWLVFRLAGLGFLGSWRVGVGWCGMKLVSCTACGPLVLDCTLLAVGTVCDLGCRMGLVSLGFLVYLGGSERVLGCCLCCSSWSVCPALFGV